MKKIQEKQGITLIALVITIIVLLILAGVAISMLAGDNGILRQAANAKKETEEGQIREQIRLAENSARMLNDGDITKDDLQKELDRYFGEDVAKIEDIENEDGTINWKVKVGKVEEIIETDETPRPKEKTLADLKGESNKATEKTTITEEDGDQVVIPKNFYVADDSGETVEEGVVVVAPDKSEFVWVPVEDINTMYGTSADGKKLGKLYDFTKNSYSAVNWTETDGTMTITRESRNTRS